MSPTENTDNGKENPELELKRLRSFFKKLTGKKKGPRNQKSKKRNKGMTLIEVSIVTGIIGILGTGSMVGAKSILDTAEETRNEISPEELQKPFGVITEKDLQEVAYLLSRACGDPEAELMAQGIETPEDLEEFRAWCGEKYYYHSAVNRGNMALEIMSRGD